MQVGEGWVSIETWEEAMKGMRIRFRMMMVCSGDGEIVVYTRNRRLVVVVVRTLPWVLGGRRSVSK